ncbi:hypothetical protein, partial [Acetobacter malorum]|uniref:hypothetical protein n=1 Tax=Acetobacter malorum TaxID=178901 RepID=UPI001E5F85CA
AKTQKLPAKHINQGFFDPSTFNRASCSSTPKKSFCFIFHSFQLTQEKWNHRECTKTRGFSNPPASSISPLPKSGLDLF